MRKIVIFGNGLGRALDNDHFQLATAMEAAWVNDECLTDDDRELIISALKNTSPESGPCQEDDLLGTQLALIGYDFISNAVHADTLDKWLTKPALSFPVAMQKYIYFVARHFHRLPDGLTEQAVWKNFIASFTSFIHATKSHVATLNYDTLLYEPFNEPTEVNGEMVQICSGFSGTLIDGYTNVSGFSPRNLERQYPERLGYYLHLHGSPLFLDNKKGKPRKIRRSQFEDQDGTRKSHIVLSHGKLKPMLIDSSPVLSMYWNALSLALEEANEIIVFGYSGADKHLNDMISRTRENKIVRVVERRTDDDDERAEYWELELSGEVSHEVYDNILEFDGW